MKPSVHSLSTYDAYRVSNKLRRYEGAKKVEKVSLEDSTFNVILNAFSLPEQYRRIRLGEMPIFMTAKNQCVDNFSTVIQVCSAKMSTD